PVLAAVIVAETAEITRFGNAGQLFCWAGLTPRHRGSGLRGRRSHFRW
ncbi:MAG: transposase, partial [Actinobacteria bacterium]|nr:transposase [Actinomycetota bacterium]